jgi:hypothetical protein
VKRSRENFNKPSIPYLEIKKYAKENGTKFFTTYIRGPNILKTYSNNISLSIYDA